MKHTISLVVYFVMFTIALFAQTTPQKITVRSEAFGNVFVADTGTLQISVSSPAQVASGTVTLADEEGNCIKRIAISADSKMIVVPLTSRGFYSLNVAVAYQNGEKAVLKTSAAVIGKQISEEARRASPLGFFGVNPSTPLSALAGGNWNRFFVHMNAISQTNNGFSWQYNSTASSPFGTGSGMMLYPKNQTWIACLMPMPRWLASGNGNDGRENPFYQYPPKDWNKFYELIRWVVTCLPPGLKYLEVMNEPDACWKGTDEELVRYHSVVSKAVKSVRPEIKVLGPSLCSIKMEVVAKLDRLGIFNDLDGVSIHPYVNGTPPEEEFIRKVIDLKKYFADSNRKNFPMFFTEFGWGTAAPAGCWQNSVDALTQARYLSRSLTLLAAQDIEALLYFCLQFNAEKWWSVINDDSTPRPAYAAFATLARALTGARKGGRWLQLTPTTHLILFRKTASTLGVLWDTAASRQVFIPIQSLVRIENMTGRTIACRSGIVTATPSPIFLEWSDTSLFDVTIASRKTVIQKQSQEFSGSELCMACPFSFNAKKILVPADTPTGDYLAIGKTDDTWQGIALSVVSPLMITSHEIRYSASHPYLRVTAHSFHDEPIHTVITLVTSKSLNISGPPTVIGARGRLTTDIPLGRLVLGKRYCGKIVIASTQKSPKFSGEAPVDFTLATAESIPDSEAKPDWKKIPPMDFSEWSPFVGVELATQLDYQDCYAIARAAYNHAGLHLQIKVRDNVHLQCQSPENMWKEDSLQIAFDLDADKAWMPNSSKWWNGHRVLEYGIAMGQTASKVWRWNSFSDLPPNKNEPRVNVQVKRIGDVTKYTILFPWGTLALAEKPASGTSIGIAIVVNDFDNDAQGRHGLRLFNGIHPQKNPLEFGRLYLK